jgi:hypothetical protein
MKGREYRAHLGRGQCWVPHLRWNKAEALDRFDSTMNKSENPDPSEPQPRFRFNVQVFQIFGLVIIALALPFTILILGLLDIRKNTKPNVSTISEANNQGSTEAPGLRATLDSIAETKLPMLAFDDGIRRFSFILRKSNNSDSEASLRSALNRVGAICVDTSKDHVEKFLARVSLEKAQEFELTLISLDPTVKPLGGIDSKSADSSLNYEITVLRE